MAVEARQDEHEVQDSRHQAALYLQRIEDGRTFVRYAERAFAEAAQMAPDTTAFGESTRLRKAAAELRRRAQECKQKGNARFNPKRTRRRVVIDTGES